MRFKNQQASSKVFVNLTPMLDVMMTILTFFIIVTMTLKNNQGVETVLPSNQSPPGQEQTKPPEPMVVVLNKQGRILVNEQELDKGQLALQMQAYLRDNPKGGVILAADVKQPYDQVIQVLGDMREIGGDRVSLALE